MDDKELARLVAADLGPDVVAAVESPPAEAMRAFGLTEAMAAGSFIATCAQLAVQVWHARQDRALLVLALAEGLDSRPELASRLDPEKRLGLMARIVDRLVPERFGSSPSIHAEKPRTKQEWIGDWLGFDERRRDMTAAVLMPFADMDSYIVYKPIYWTRPLDVPASLPASMTVPFGFVTDLASRSIGRGLSTCRRACRQA